MSKHRSKNTIDINDRTVQNALAEFGLRLSEDDFNALILALATDQAALNKPGMKKAGML